MAWLEEQGKSYDDPLTLGDLMDLGFDPTRLKEITIDGEPLHLRTGSNETTARAEEKEQAAGAHRIRDVRRQRSAALR